MKLALIQLHSKPTEVKENVDKGVGMYREAVEKGAELVVFPELWTCGYYLETFDFEAARSGKRLDSGKIPRPCKGKRNGHRSAASPEKRREAVYRAVCH